MFSDESMCQALLEIMEPEINKIRIEVQRKLVAEEIKEYIPGLLVEEIKAIGKGLGDN